MAESNEYRPWQNDWVCTSCHQSNTGRDRNCRSCGKKIPNDIWINMSRPTQRTNERKYCKQCGRTKDKSAKNKDLLSTHICEKR